MVGRQSGSWENVIIDRSHAGTQDIEIKLPFVRVVLFSSVVACCIWTEAQ